MTAVVTSAVSEGSSFGATTLSLCLTIFRVLFSQVNNGLRDIFISSRVTALLAGQRFMIAWRRYRTPVQVKIASVPGKE